MWVSPSRLSGPLTALGVWGGGRVGGVVMCVLDFSEGRGIVEKFLTEECVFIFP